MFYGFLLVFMVGVKLVYVVLLFLSLFGSRFFKMCATCLMVCHNEPWPHNELAIDFVLQKGMVHDLSQR